MSSIPDLGAPTWALVNDKVAHAGAYGVLGGTLAWGHRRSGGAIGHGWLLVAGALYGVTDEIHQVYVPGRSPDPADLAADVVGLLLGYGTTRALLGRTMKDQDAGDGEPVEMGDAS
ncbi:MAG: VanZ family protein [Longimicrobiales bacterium]|nr:VanZ family protein [Longimicrobiales bacterium]